MEEDRYERREGVEYRVIMKRIEKNTNIHMTGM